MNKKIGNQEPERKFVINKLPEISLGEPETYRQIYIPNPVGLVMRVRQEGEKNVLQFKKRNPDPLSSPFESQKLDFGDAPEIFVDLLDWGMNANSPKVVEKQRYTLARSDTIGAKEIVVDVFHGPLAGHFLAEAEFDTANDMANWKLPAWLADVMVKEVTGDERFNNEWLAENGWPEEV